jgi:hypothetical protein
MAFDYFYTVFYDMGKQVASYILLFFTTCAAWAQFYNGHQMVFGKNRVQYNDFYWSYYRYEDFDVYFNQNGKNLANYTAEYLEDRISELESYLDYRLDKRIIFIVFNKLTDLRQTNIGLITGQEESNLGGVTTIQKNKVFVYFDGNHENYRQQMDAVTAEVILHELLYGANLKENVTNTTLINLPEWYLPGLVSYISKEWDLEIENMVKDGILNKRYKKFYHLQKEEAVYAGHSFWKYIADTYGKAIIPDILYLTRIYKNANQGFLYSIGMSVKDLSRDWMDHYFDHYCEQADDFNIQPGGPLISKPKQKLIYHNLKINGAQDKIAYVTHKRGKYTIWLLDVKTGKKKKIFQRGHNIEQITDYTFPAMAWHPSGRILTFITEEQGGLKIYYYNLEENQTASRNFLYFEKVLDYSFSHDGFKIVMSAVRNNQADIFVYTLASATSEQITDDVADDFTPRFINNSSDIIFSSNRLDDINSYQDTEFKTDVVHKLYIAGYPKKNGNIKKLETPEYSNSHYPFETEKNQYIFLNDANGIFNRYVASFDSVISYIDTAIHYRYVTQTSPTSNYFNNIEEQYHTNNKTGEVVFNRGNRKFYFDTDQRYNPNTNLDLPNTAYRPKMEEKLKLRDSINRMVIDYIPIDEIEQNTLVLPEGDTIELETWDININNYIFEQEKINFYNKKLENRNIRIVQDTLPEKKPRIRIYEKAFYPNYLVTQVDFHYTNTSYQVFTGGQVYFNPGLNAMMKIGTNDLFEDYRILLGYKLTADFNSNEFLLSFENLKDRTDKQYIYHRQSFRDYRTVGGERLLYRFLTHELMYVARYPFNQVFSLRGTAKLRYDRGVQPAVDDESLSRPSTHSVWTGGKGELVYDNTRSPGMNLYSGIRWKTFGEAYFQVDNDFSDLFVLGTDFRYYVPIHRTLTWAFRTAGSTSFGNSKLIYYLGGVDNWTNLSFRVPTFDNSVPINNRQNYAFQTLATNMRGFSQNIRNGNNFALINTELRWPIIRYFANRPIANNFLNHFQLVGFFDVGSAWQGLTPYSKKNAYDKTVMSNGLVTISVDSNRDPIVAGYGFGLRTMLLGYFIRLDWARGIENRTVLPRVIYFSLNLDF